MNQYIISCKKNFIRRYEYQLGVLLIILHTEKRSQQIHEKLLQVLIFHRRW